MESKEKGAFKNKTSFASLVTKVRRTLMRLQSNARVPRLLEIQDRTTTSRRNLIEVQNEVRLLRQ